MNWVQTSGIKYTKEEANRAKKKFDEANKGRKKKMIKVNDKPPTYKEIFVDDD